MPEPVRPPVMDSSPRLAAAYDQYLDALIAWAMSRVGELVLGSLTNVEIETKHIEMLCAKAVLDWEMRWTITALAACGGAISGLDGTDPCKTASHTQRHSEDRPDA